MSIRFLNRFMEQKWENLLLLHWPVEKEKITPTLPADLEVDLFEKQAWLSVVGFKLTGLRISPIRPILWPSFWEINLRTYVRDRRGNKGVWFYSLDSSDPFAVSGARLLYGLKYNFAETEGILKDDKITFISHRKFPHQKANSKFHAQLPNFKQLDNLANSKIDNFLLERYRFWSIRKFGRKSESANVKHSPYRSVKVREAVYNGDLFRSQGFAEPSENPQLGHFCEGLDVQASAPEWAFSIAGHANHKYEDSFNL